MVLRERAAGRVPHPSPPGGVTPSAGGAGLGPPAGHGAGLSERGAGAARACLAGAASARGLRPRGVLWGAHASDVEAGAFSPDGKLLASGGDDKAVRLWEVGTGKEALVFKEHKEKVTALAFGPEGK